MMSKYPVLEIFESVQGEGRFTGKLVTFIRFAGCNLSCPWCDTKDQLSSGKVEMLTAKEIAERVHTTSVVLTGGEPTLYELDPICFELTLNRVNWIAIETNGSGRVPSWIDVISCSPKKQNGYKIHESILTEERSGTEVDYKYVVDDAIKFRDIHIPTGESSIVYLQPEFYSGKESVEKALSFLKELDGECNVRLGIQAHKYWEVE